MKMTSTERQQQQQAGRPAGRQPGFCQHARRQPGRISKCSRNPDGAFKSKDEERLRDDFALLLTVGRLWRARKSDEHNICQLLPNRSRYVYQSAKIHVTGCYPALRARRVKSLLYLSLITAVSAEFSFPPTHTRSVSPELWCEAEEQIMGNTCMQVSAAVKSGGPATSGAASTSGTASTNKLKSLELQQQREREAGQQQLREIVECADRDGLALDWVALIKKAEELHQRDRHLERKRQRMVSKSRSEDRGHRKRLRKSGGGGAGSDGTGMGECNTIGGRWQQSLERRRRRRAEAVGSFSVNLTLYRNETELPLLHNEFSYDDKLSGIGILDDPAATNVSSNGSQADTAPGLSSVDEETDCSLGLSDGFKIGTNVGEELETIQE